MEMKQHEQYERIMSTLGEYRENISELEMDRYKIKCSVHYLSEVSTLDSTYSKQSIE